MILKIPLEDILEHALIQPPRSDIRNVLAHRYYLGKVPLGSKLISETFSETELCIVINYEPIIQAKRN